MDFGPKQVIQSCILAGTVTPVAWRLGGEAGRRSNGKCPHKYGTLVFANTPYPARQFERIGLVPDDGQEMVLDGG